MISPPGTLNLEAQSQSSQPEVQTVYTHSPPLHANLLLGSLQLLFWLLVHPSAWQNYIKRIAPDLRPDFYLAELKQRHWRSPALRQLLIKGYVVWPLLVGLVIWLSGLAQANRILETSQPMVSRIAFVVAISLALALAGGLMVSVAVGIAGGVAGSIAFSLAAVYLEERELIVALVVMIGLALGVAGSVAFGAASVVPGSRAGHRPSPSIIRQMSGIVIGILIGLAGTIIAGSLAISMASQLNFSTAREMVFGVAGGGAINVARGIAFGAVSGMAVGVAVGRRTHVRQEVIFGTFFGVLVGLTRIVAVAGAGVELIGVTNAAMLTALFALSYVLAERIAGPWAGAVAGALGSGSVFFLSIIGDYPRWPILPIGVGCIILGLTLAWWRPVVLYPLISLWNLLLYRLDYNQLRSSQGDRLGYLRWHAAFWDEYQRLPYLNLDDHLLLVLKWNPVAGKIALTYLINSPQRWAAQAAQIEMDAGSLEAYTDVSAVSQAYRSLAAGELTGPASALLRSFSRLSQDIEAALRQESAYNQRLALSAVEERLDGLFRELTRSSEPYAGRFLPIIHRWRDLVAGHGRELAAAAEARQEIDNPYIIGVPLTEQQEIFIGRTDISARIEQLLRDQRRPPLLLYGQRRMGKTSLLNNLGRLLPTTIVPLFVDMQGAARAEGHAGLLYNIARDIAKSAKQRRNLNLPILDQAALSSDPFTRFDEWLDRVEQRLNSREQYTALLALDEFEALNSALARGRYDEEDVLGMLRHLIQHRPCFKVLLAGSHHLDEFQRWAGYLINVQVVHLGYLQEAEARQLIEQPVKDFTLRYEAEAGQRVLALTRGHPFLIQLLCAEIVALKNEQEPARRRLASLADIEAAVPEALNSGSFFFADIQRNQIDAGGAVLLQALAAQGEGAILNREQLGQCAGLSDQEQLNQTITHLLQRELIEPVDGGYRFQVELIRRSFVRGEA